MPLYGRVTAKITAIYSYHPYCNNGTDQVRNICGAPPDFYCHYCTISRHAGYDSFPLERCRPLKWLHVKVMGLFLFPVIMAGFVALFVLLPRIDPLKKNYDKFRRYYEGFIQVFVVYLLAYPGSDTLYGVPEFRLAQYDISNIIWYVVYLSRVPCRTC